MAIEKLTAADMRRARSGEVGKYHDGGGLILRVRKNGSAAWVLRYARDGQRREMGLGALDHVPLQAARTMAAEHRLAIARDIDPLGVRQATRAQRARERASLVTFADAVEQLLTHREKSSTNKRLEKYWRSTLETYAVPKLGTLAVATIERQHVLKVVEPLWHAKPETAARVRARIEAVLDAAAARGQRPLENPARWDALKPVLGKRGKPVKNFAALPWRELPAFLKRVRQEQGLAARALEFAILTTCRSNEVLGARWDEVAGDVWTVPGARTKMRRPHKVPLSPEARALLDRLHNVRRPPFIFFGERAGRPLSNMSMLMLLRRLKRDDITVHGFRSSFRSWAADQGHDSDLAEFALAHVPAGVEAIYQRSDLFERRRTLMEAWAKYCYGQA